MANRAVGSRTRFNKLSASGKPKAIEEFGPQQNNMFTSTDKLESIQENKTLTPVENNINGMLNENLHTLVSGREKIIKEENVLRKEIDKNEKIEQKKEN